VSIAYFFSFFLYSHCVWGKGHCSRQNQNIKGCWGDSGWISSEDWHCHAWCVQRERSRELVLLGYTSSLKYIILFYTFLSNLNSRKISNLNIFNGLLDGTCFRRGKFEVVNFSMFIDSMLLPKLFLCSR